MTETIQLACNDIKGAARGSGKATRRIAEAMLWSACCYSQRSDFKGSARIARTAGTQAAEIATSANIAGTETNVSGSVALTP